MKCNHDWGIAKTEKVLVSKRQCQSCGLSVSVGNDDVVGVGDTMLITTELLKDIDKQPNHSTQVVSVVRIETDEDGHKKLWLEKVP